MLPWKRTTTRRKVSSTTPSNSHFGCSTDRLISSRNPRLERQMADPLFYGPVKFDAADSGGLQGIKDLESATAAIEIVIHQGEGLSDERWADPAHQGVDALLQVPEDRRR